MFVFVEWQLPPGAQYKKRPPIVSAALPIDMLKYRINLHIQEMVSSILLEFPYYIFPLFFVIFFKFLQDLQALCSPSL